MARKGMTVTIVAKIDQSKPDGVDFHMEDEDGVQIDTLVFRKDKYPGMKKDDDHEVSFGLDQEQGLTLEFAHSLDDVLWVEMGDDQTIPPCPTTEPAQKSTIFFAERSRPRRMVAINTNPKCQKFSFTINFIDRTNSGPKKLIPFDPGGSNENGGVGFMDTQLNTLILVGFASAVLAAFATYLFMR